MAATGEGEGLGLPWNYVEGIRKHTAGEREGVCHMGPAPPVLIASPEKSQRTQPTRGRQEYGIQGRTGVLHQLRAGQFPSSGEWGDPRHWAPTFRQEGGVLEQARPSDGILSPEIQWRVVMGLLGLRRPGGRVTGRGVLGKSDGQPACRPGSS